MTDCMERILSDYNKFEDGLLLSFKYFYDENNRLAVKAVLHGRNAMSENGGWDKVCIMVSDVKELCVKVKGNTFNSIFHGVSILREGALLCMDIDGNYPTGQAPSTFEEVRYYGECYVIGSRIDIYTLLDV